MWLWAVLTIIVGVTAAALTIPLVRRHEAGAGRGGAAAQLAASLADIDAQVAAATLDPATAEAMRTEARRRTLAARAPVVAARPLGAPALGRLAIGLAAVVAVAATALYATLGRPDLAGEAVPAAAAAAAPATDAASAQDVAAMVGQLERKMAANPSDPEGWRMLGWSYFQTQRWADSATAYGKAVALAPKAPGYASAYGEALVQAAGGSVTPLAKAQFAAARDLDANDARARYFLGLAKAQGGDRTGAIDDWLALLARSPPDAPYLGQLRQIILDTARTAGIDVAGRLATAPVAGVAAPPADQAAAVQAMAPGDQQAFIRQMVDRLAAKLRADPKDAEGWVRLMRARLVLGDAAAAQAARADGLAALKGDAAGTATVEQGAAALGVR